MYISTYRQYGCCCVAALKVLVKSGLKKFRNRLFAARLFAKVVTILNNLFHEKVVIII